VIYDLQPKIVTLQTADGKQKRIQVAALSDADKEILEPLLKAEPGPITGRSGTRIRATD
jgi:hypothetical protein